MIWAIKMGTGAGKTLNACTLFWRFCVLAPSVRKFCKEQGDVVFGIAKSAFERTLRVAAVSDFLGLPKRTLCHYAQTKKIDGSKGARPWCFSLIDVVEYALRNHSEGWLEWRRTVWSEKHPLMDFGSLALRTH